MEEQNQVGFAGVVEMGQSGTLGTNSSRFGGLELPVTPQNHGDVALELRDLRK